MIRYSVRTAAALTLVGGTLSLTSPSRADDGVVGAPAAAPVVVPQPAPIADTVQTRTETTGPDIRMISGGILTFGISYGVSVGIAATSGHRGDDHLYVPLVGPWLDFADRGNCPKIGSCTGETANRVFIAADGVFQAVGVLAVVSGLVFDRTREVTTTTSGATRPAVQITPVGYAHGGLGASELAGPIAWGDGARHG